MQSDLHLNCQQRRLHEQNQYCGGSGNDALIFANINIITTIIVIINLIVHSLLWSIGYSEIVGSKMGEFFEGVSSPSCWIEYQSLSCDQLDWNVVINIITIFLILFIGDDDYKGRAGWGKLWSRVHEVESRTRTLWADKRLREPDQRESQTKSEWARMCENEPECARVS